MWKHSTEAGPALLIDTPPAFADERYGMLARAASAGGLDAALRLVEISRAHGHLEGEACWLALATRLGHHAAHLPLAQVYRRAGLFAEARARAMAACGHGDDEAVRTVLGYPPDARREAVEAGAPPGWDFDAVLAGAAEHGSITAQYELGLRAAGRGDHGTVVRLLKRPAADGNVHARYLLGSALLELGERAAGRRWLRDAGRAGHLPARLLYARTALNRRPAELLARELVAGFDAEHTGPTAGEADKVALLVEVAGHCRERALTDAAMACLGCAASAGDGAAMARLARLHLNRHRLDEAGRWLDRARAAGIEDTALREASFTLACSLSRSGDGEAGRRRLTEAANAGHHEATRILAGLSPLPPPSRVPQPHVPRNLRFSLGVIRDILTDRRLARLFNRLTTTVGTPIIVVGLVLVGWGLVSAFQGRGAAATYGIVGMVTTIPGIALTAWRVGRNPPRRRRDPAPPLD